MIEFIYLDVETRNKLSITDVGSARYASDRSCGINCIQWAADDGPLNLIPYEALVEQVNALGQLIPTVDPRLQNLFDTIEQNSKAKIVAHNAAFEWAILFYVLGKYYPPERWVDTMAKCAYFGYPLGLDDAAKALQLPLYKDLGGKAIMQVLASGKYTPADRPGDFNGLYKYCGVDVGVMRHANKALPPLPDAVQARWEMDFEINMRGVPINMRMVNNAVSLRAIFQERDNANMAAITGGAVQTVGQVGKIQEFAQKLGVEMVDCSADTVTRALNNQQMPEPARKVLELRQEAGATSLAKYQKMADYVVGDRLCNMFFWYGAHTGRPTGSGPQVMNLPRSSEGFEFWANVLENNPWYLTQVSEPSQILKDTVRASVCAPDGYEFVGMDLSQIEARATGWLAGANEFLQLFTTSDPYCTYGAKMFGRAIDKKKDPVERNAAKAGVLAYGFAGGIGAGQRIGNNYSFDFNVMADLLLPSAMPEELAVADRCFKYYMRTKPIKPLTYREAQAVDILKQRYRKDFPEIPLYWEELEETFMNGGWAKRICVHKKDNGLRIVTLPSGRQLFYHGVKSELVKVLDEDTGKEKFEREFRYQGRRGRKRFWKGTLIENAAQAVNQDIADWYKLRANKFIAPVVHHCYDEFTMLCKVSEVDSVVNALKDLMKTKPPECHDLPIGFDYWTGRIYGK